MTKLERLTGITLLTAIICNLQFGIFGYVYERASAVIAALTKAISL